MRWVNVLMNELNRKKLDQLKKEAEDELWE